jgi:uncharacterized protein (TIGR00375 family)
MKIVYGDFHIHIGQAQGRPVKMAASKNLTLKNLLHHAKNEKGLHIVTVIDGVCPPVQVEVLELIEAGHLQLVAGGGYLYEDSLLVILGAEVEIAGPFKGRAHFGCWFGDIHAAKSFSEFLSTVQKNNSLSSQLARCEAVTLQREVMARGGMFIVHHAFTPHKGIYGNCVEHLSDMLDMSAIDALELGLSANTAMADTIPELSHLSFLSNSDAHSLAKIAREYNELKIKRLSFEEVSLAFARSQGRAITANYGLTPELGKYHRTYCLKCEQIWKPGASECQCGSQKRVPGVYDRLLEIQERQEPIHPEFRPPYIHQVPLEFIPGIGPKARGKLLDVFHTEMAVLHVATVEQIAEVVGSISARVIDDARMGRLSISVGGGGVYGKIRLG